MLQVLCWTSEARKGWTWRFLSEVLDFCQFRWCHWQCLGGQWLDDRGHLTCLDSLAKPRTPKFSGKQLQSFQLVLHGFFSRHRRTCFMHWILNRLHKTELLRVLETFNENWKDPSRDFGGSMLEALDLLHKKSTLQEKRYQFSYFSWPGVPLKILVTSLWCRLADSAGRVALLWILQCFGSHRRCWLHFETWDIVALDQLPEEIGPKVSPWLQNWHWTINQFFEA